MPYTIGITGGIGSGKSAVAELFAGHGIAVIDADAIAYELTGPEGMAIEPIRAAFGAGAICPDGTLDRPKMRKLVFGDVEARKKLEAILHPLIRERSAGRGERARSAYVILVVPLLIEVGVDRSRCQRILVIECTEAQQIERVMRRSGLSEKEVREIIAAQATREQRLSQADDVIDNSGPPEALAPQVARLNEKYLTLVEKFRTPS